jgi:hypothetical protein
MIIAMGRENEVGLGKSYQRRLGSLLKASDALRKLQSRGGHRRPGEEVSRASVFMEMHFHRKLNISKALHEVEPAC